MNGRMSDLQKAFCDLMRLSDQPEGKRNKLHQE
jgi:hypothetical protein